MPPTYPREVREKTVELRSQGVMPTEITWRLNNDRAGLGYPCSIKVRTVKGYLQDYKAKHGDLPRAAPEDIEADSIAKAKARLFARAVKEVQALERIAKGKMPAAQADKLRHLYGVLDSMEGVSERAEARRRKPSSLGRSGTPEKAQREAKPPTVAELLAGKAQEAAITGPHMPDPQSTQTNGETQDVGSTGAAGEDAADREQVEDGDGGQPWSASIEHQSTPPQPVPASPPR